MRNLTVQRHKSFVACLAKLRVYIEDAAVNELTISGVPCRKLGELKNGEAKTFSVGNEAKKIFVIGDIPTKDTCGELYQLPEGEEDIVLSGKCRFTLPRTSAFYFDGVTDEATLQNRKKGSKRMTVVLIIAAIVGGVIGFCSGMGWFEGPAKPKTFRSDGFAITLTDEYKKTTFDGMTAAYDSENAAVLLLKELTAAAESVGVQTAEEYAEMQITYYKLQNPSEIYTKDGLLYYEYEGIGENGKMLRFLCFVFKTNDYYWTVQFTSLASDYADMKDDFFDFAKSIRFSEEINNV